jgi:hypothetical protein
MTARPHAIARPDRPGVGGIFAVVLIVVFLAATVLFAEASAHHAGGHVYVGQAVADPAGVHHHETAHEHQHGNDWTPQPTKRLRVTASVLVIAAITVMAALPDQAGVAAVVPTAVVDPALSLLGVLRI